MDKKKITRGNVANYFGISKNAVRNYEKLLLVEPEKEDNNYRYFTEEDISSIAVVRVMRELGWSLPDIYDLTHECCGLSELSDKIGIHIKRLLEQQQQLIDKIDKMLRINSSVNKAMMGPRYEILDCGPTILWNFRLMSDESRNSWFSYMPMAAISDILTFSGREINAQTGVAVIEGVSPLIDTDLPGPDRRIETGHCVHCIKPCQLINGDYVYEDYEPILAYAAEKGFHPANWLITYGLTSLRMEGIPVYYLEIWLPLMD